MTNRNLMAKAIADGVADKNALLTRVLAGNYAPHPAQTKGQWKSAAGWLCSACMVCLILIGYFNGTITLRTQGEEETALAGAAAFDAATEESGLLSSMQPPLPETAPLVAQEEPAQQSKESPTAPVAQALPTWEALGQGGWVRTNQEVVVQDKPNEPNYETDTGDSGGTGNTVAPKPDKPKPDLPEDGGPTNPDTGGGGIFVEVPYQNFIAGAAYSAYRGYVPSNLVGFSAYPLVGYTPPDKGSLGGATIHYGNPAGTVKQVFSVIVQGDPEGAPLITTAAQITPDLLKKFNDPLPQNVSSSLFISVSFNIQGRQVCFESQNVSYEQAAQVLQSLPALNGGAIS